VRSEGVGHGQRGDRLGFINAVAKFVDEVAIAFLVEGGFEGLADEALSGGLVHGGSGGAGE